MIINGKEIEGIKGEVSVKLGEVEVKLRTAFVEDYEVPTEFTWLPIVDGVTIISKLVGNRVSSTIKIKNKVMYENLCAAAVFTVMVTKYGVTRDVCNRAYVRANPVRKEYKVLVV